MQTYECFEGYGPTKEIHEFVPLIPYDQELEFQSKIFERKKASFLFLKGSCHLTEEGKLGENIFLECGEPLTLYEPI